MKKIAPSIKSFLLKKGFAVSSIPQSKMETEKNEEYFELCPPIGVSSKAIVNAVKEFFDTAGYVTKEDHGTISVFKNNKQIYRAAVTSFNMPGTVAPFFGVQSGLMYLSIFHLMEDKKVVSRFLRYVNQLFCRHDYELADKNEQFPSPPEGGAIAFSRLHICTKCEHKTMLGSGWIT